MSSARLLGDNPPYTSSLPDCDFNVSDPEPFIKASKELLGENGCKWMLAYGTMKEGEAFRNTCRSKGMNFDEFNEVAKNIDDYREDEKWKPIIDEANKFVDVIVSASAHPCSNILFDGDLEEELGVLKIGDFICCPITSGEADEWKYLKNDYLTVSTVTLTKRVFDMIGIPRMTLVELENALDETTSIKASDFLKSLKLSSKPCFKFFTISLSVIDFFNSEILTFIASRVSPTPF